MNIKVRYCGSPLLEWNNAGEWIDLYTAENVALKAGDFQLISLGICMQLPKGTEANIVPRSSTFKRYGIIQCNHFGVIDTSYCGDDDVWKFSAYATRDVNIPVGTRICQFRLNKTMRHEFGEIEFEPVTMLDLESRGGFGSTGT